MGYPVAYRSSPRPSHSASGFQGSRVPFPARKSSGFQAQGNVLRPNRFMQFRPLIDPNRKAFGRAQKALGGLARRGFPWATLAQDTVGWIIFLEGLSYLSQNLTGGWTQYNLCTTPGGQYQGNESNGVQAASCLTGQAVAGARPFGSKLQFSTTRSFIQWRLNPNAFGVRYDTYAHYSRPVGNSFVGPYQQVLPDVGLDPLQYPMPLNWPALDPFSAPIGQFTPTPNPIPISVLPLRQPNPNRVPEEQPRWGTALPAPWDASAPEVDPSARPVTPPIGAIRSEPGTQPNQWPQAPQATQLFPKAEAISPEHENRPPPPRTKEKKLIASVAQQSAVGRIFNAVTETQDMVDAFYGAIPWSIRREWDVKGRVKYWRDPAGHWHKAKTPLQTKAWRVYQHWSDIDMKKALQNVLRNQIGDAIGGTLGGVNAKSQKHLPGAGQGPGTVQRHAPQPDSGMLQDLITALGG